MINLFSNVIQNYLFKKKLKFIGTDDPHIIFSDIWSGNSQNGELITNAKYPINEIQNIDNFNFLRDLKSCGILKTRSIARKIVNHWIDNNKNLNDYGVDSIIAMELSNWCKDELGIEIQQITAEWRP